jgi:hypothetical protein
MVEQNPIEKNNAEPVLSNISAEPEKVPEITTTEPAPTTPNF